jgi:hypothetical protein
MDPWDIPSFPRRGDRSERVTHAAVGRAMSEWEKVEVSLAHLFSVMLTGSRFDPAANAEYGVALNFKERQANLEKVACKFFCAHPSQEREGTFSSIASRAIRFSARRNDIAHSVARPIQFIIAPKRRQQLYRWCIVPGHFKKTAGVNEPFERDSNPRS